VSEDERLEQMRRRWDDCRQSRDHLAMRVLLLEGLLRDLMKYQRGGHPFRQDEIDAVRAALLGKQGESAAAVVHDPMCDCDGFTYLHMCGAVGCRSRPPESIEVCMCSPIPDAAEAFGGQYEGYREAVRNCPVHPTEVCGACGDEGFIMGEGTCIPCRGTGRTPRRSR
jgi:hypothetical protein